MRRFSRIGLAWVTATVVAVTIAATAVSSVRSEITDAPTALGISASPPTTLNALEEPVDTAADSTADQPAPTTTTLAVVSDATTATVTEIVATTTTTPQVRAKRVQASEPTPDPEPTPAPDSVHEVKSLPQGDSGSPSQTSSRRSANTTTTTEPVNTSPDKPTTPPTTSSTPTSAPPPATTSTTSSTTTTSTTTTSTTTTLPPVTTVDTYTRLIATEGGSVAVLVSGDAVMFRRAFPQRGWRFALADGGPDEVEVRFQQIEGGTMKIRVELAVEDGELVVVITTAD